MKRFAFLAAVLFGLAPVAAFANPKLDSALCDAAQHGTPAAIKMLVKKGAHVNTACSGQTTPLEHSARADNIANMTALLDAGADVDAWSGGDACCQETAIGYAYSVPTARFLLAHHANVNVRRLNDGSTPLIWRAMSVTMSDTDQSADDDTKIAQLLIDAGADVNAADHDGTTPLIMGVGAHSKSFVELLLDHGANVNARSSNGVAALDVTMNLENSPLTPADDLQALRDLEAFLRAHGAVQ